MCGTQHVITRAKYLAQIERRLRADAGPSCALSQPSAELETRYRDAVLACPDFPLLFSFALTQSCWPVR